MDDNDVIAAMKVLIENVKQKKYQLTENNITLVIDHFEVFKPLIKSHLEKDSKIHDGKAVLEKFKTKFEELELYKEPSYIFTAQQLAVFTYKDPDVPDFDKFENALEIIMPVYKDQKTVNSETGKEELAETLGIIGSLYKRKWYRQAQLSDLVFAYEYYKEGADLCEQKDLYCLNNVAFLLDVLHSLDHISSIITDNNADEIRNDICNRLENKTNSDYWSYVTLAENQLALGRTPDAILSFKKALEFEHKEWEIKSSLEQITELVRIRKNVIAKDFFDKLKEINIYYSPVNKIGLALSGGGFRASFYHIGVLAKLAEMDVLKKVEIISTVSGGSIIGGYYYLALKEKYDKNEIRDYNKIISQISKDFYKKVQKNLRMRLFSNLWFNIKQFLLPSVFNRSSRIADLYDKHLYQQFTKKKNAAFHDIKIFPKGETDFNPKYDNWKKDEKVPELIVNATTLNTGHNWTFTSTYMGEPPYRINRLIDSLFRLKRTYYTDLKDGNANFPFSKAIAASACVPGVFEPIEIPGMYPGITVSLVDGGVSDNQGVNTLLERDCRIILISDASGQMAETDYVNNSLVNTLDRSQSVLDGNLRNNRLLEIKEFERHKVLDAAMLVHLTQDIENKEIGIKDNDAKEESDILTASVDDPQKTYYGVNKKIQKALAEIRTDLDNFSQWEANALMLSGYLATQHQFSSHPNLETSFPNCNNTECGDWKFLKLKDQICVDVPGEEILNHLQVGKEKFFRILKYNRIIKYTSTIGIVILLLVLFFLFFINYYIEITKCTVIDGLLIFLPFFSIPIISKVIWNIMRRKQLPEGTTVWKELWGDIKKQSVLNYVMYTMGIVLWIPAWLHLLIVTPLLNRIGKMKEK
ncbi:MAG: hypothetical protein JWN78_2798 [Bacteroidota bacterium]|nr:hypothetical protein [Bacteroidota bacterium]